MKVAKMTSSKIEELFLTIKAFWPAHVNISDGELLDDEGFLSWNLNRREEQVSENIPNDGASLEASIWP